MTAEKPHVLISESVTYCTSDEGVEIAPRAMPFLEQWMEAHAHELGYVKAGEVA